MYGIYELSQKYSTDMNTKNEEKKSEESDEQDLIADIVTVGGFLRCLEIFGMKWPNHPDCSEILDPPVFWCFIFALSANDLKTSDDLINFMELYELNRFICIPEYASLDKKTYHFKT